MSAERLLIVNADDFGRSPGINDGVVRAFEDGIVTSASLMVRWPAAAAAAKYARAHAALSVGLHVDLGEWCWSGGRWQRRYDVVDSASRDDVAREVAAQLARFRDLMGENPTHLDSHQHAHRREPLRSILRELARELRVPLRHESPDLTTWLEFYGETRTGRPVPQAIAPERLIEWLSTLGPDPVELRCHPAGAPDVDGYRDARCVETGTLCDPRVRLAVRRFGVDLRSFRSVPIAPWEGRDALARGDADRAVRIFERAAAAHGRLVWPWLWLARARRAAGDARGSLQALSHAIRLAPDSASALTCAIDLLDVADGDARRIPGDAAAGLGVRDVEGLRTLAAQLASLSSPSATRARDVLAQICGFTAEAGSAVTVPPASARVDAARYLAAGDPVSAWRLVRDVPEHAGSYLLGRTARSLRELGHLQDGIRAFDAALRLTPDDADLLQAREAAEGEWQALSGRWSPPDLAPFSIEPDPFRVLHVVGPSLPGVQSGYTLRTHEIVRAQREAGVDASVATELGFPGDASPCPSVRHDLVHGVPYHRLGAGRDVPVRLDDRLTAHARSLYALVRERRPGLLHAASDWRNAAVALAAGRAARIPVVYEMRGVWEDTWRAGLPGGAMPGERYELLRAREVACALAADHVVTLSEAMRGDLIARGVPAEHIDVIPNGVDADTFQPHERDTALGDALGIPAGRTVVGCISTLNPYEGLDCLLHALALLVRRGAPVYGLIVGDGPDRDRLHALAADLEIERSVRFTGRVPHDQVVRFHSLLDVFVIPRADHRVTRLVPPLKPLEAMAMERPIVAADLPALRELVHGDLTGRLFRSGDPDSLAAALLPLVAAPILRRRLGRAGRALVLRSHTWSRVARRSHALYRRLSPAAAGKGLCL